MTRHSKDIAAGLFFVTVGIFYGSIAWLYVPIGQALNMGPGYFPIALSSALTVLGAIIAARGIFTEKTTSFGVVPWRAVVMLSLSTIVFAALIEKLGMLPGIFLSALIAIFAHPTKSPFRAILTSLGISVFCTAIFSYGVRLPIPVIGSWLSW